ncbi:MAG: cytochrome c biogenesis heme-transporting ATPase CcmA [Gammaproteobacteria bacterium]|nr:cytochrome c biogenesis heme-transporting ATPase CcmA [Gammaproteobacteria bacterium]
MSQEFNFKACKISLNRAQMFIFENLTLELSAGEVLLIEGANGSGKTSLLKILAGLMTATSGVIYWQGKIIEEGVENYRDNFHYIGHHLGIKTDLTVEENLTLFAKLAGKKYHPACLTVMHLNHKQHCLARFLSAGEKRKIALAKLIMIPKRLWILDEPLTALDHATQTLFITLLRQHIHQGGMAILSSHQKISLLDLPCSTIKLSPC